MENNKAVMALGFFDGVHLGHAALLERAKLRAAELGARPAVLTFDSHPDNYVKKEKVELISSPTDRVYIIKHYFGIENVFFLHFNASVMRMPWRDFIDEIREKYSVAHFVAGHDFRCGYRGEGRAEVLRDYCHACGVGFDIIEPVCANGRVISSTLIRERLCEGDIEGANALLGHPHLMTDTIRTGYRIGHTIEAPTINMRFQENVLVPRHGVYATTVELPCGTYGAVTNVGVRPTFGGDSVTVESNILDFSGDLYGQNACVRFYGFIRPERRFDTPEELMLQIRRDADTAAERLSHIESR